MQQALEHLKEAAEMAAKMTTPEQRCGVACRPEGVYLVAQRIGPLSDLVLASSEVVVTWEELDMSLFDPLEDALRLAAMRLDGY